MGRRSKGRDKNRNAQSKQRGAQKAVGLKSLVSSNEEGRATISTQLACAVVVVAALLAFFKAGGSPNASLHTYRHTHELDTEVISLEPRIYMLRNILSPAECDQIKDEVMRGKRVPSSTGWRSSSDKKELGEWRRSITGWIRKDERGASPIVRTLISRVASAANVSVSMLQRGNPLHVTEYQPGGFYMPHLDSRHVEDLDKVPSVRDYGENLPGYKVEGGYPYTARYFTALCYLSGSEDFKGGNTVFPLASSDGSKKDQRLKGIIKGLQTSTNEITMAHWERRLPPLCEGRAEEGISVSPEKGSCALFYNHFAGEDGPESVGQIDHLSLHAGCPITEGSKWIANVWGEALPTESVRREGAEKAAAESAAYKAGKIPEEQLQI